MSLMRDYRPDIDGLRAIAVLSVLLYHLGISWIPGGFVGVDIFFVISGFLITTIIYREYQEGSFSYGRFYERRIRRLLPALAVMLLLTSVPGWLLLLPEDYKLFSEAQGLSALFLTNIHFWNKTDYFNDAVENIPLLHTWSLAVEEQFYLIFPPLLMLASRLFPGHIKTVIFCLALISLVAAERALSSTPESAFYLVHLRGWELLTGALLAVGAVPALRAIWLREVAAVTGLVLIVGSVLILDKHSRFPGAAALPAVLGSALIIHAGREGCSLVGRLLSIRPVVFVGLISYSLYLWHWPLIVFSGYVLLSPLSTGNQLILFCLSILCGWMSWRYVERPFRRATGVFSRRRFFRNSIATGGMLVALSMPGVLTDGAPGRLPEEVIALDSIGEESIPFRKGCFGLEPASIKLGNICRLGSDGEADFLLWGDSHALALAHGVHTVAKDVGRTGYFLGRSACPPVLGSRDFKASSTSCRIFNEHVADFVAQNKNIRHVILAGYWSNYQDDGEEDDAADSFAAGLERTLGFLAGQDMKITLIDQVPGARMHVPSVMARSVYFSETDVDIPVSEHHLRMGPFHHMLTGLREHYTFTVHAPESIFCNASICASQLEGKPLYRDSHHLSRWGAEQMRPIVEQILSDAGRTEDGLQLSAL